MHVIFSDNHLLLVVKNPGIPTQEDKSGTKSVHELAKEWVKRNFAKKGAVFLEPVHRLDKPVGGLVLFARTSKALSRLHALLREGRLKKTYLAYVSGSFAKKEGSLEHYLFHDEFRARVVLEAHPGAKRALLHYRALAHEDGVTLLEISLETGRYHQIRSQLAHVGHPILGDFKYGSTFSFKKGEIALAHVRMEFFHPVRQELLSFAAPQEEERLRETVCEIL